METKKENKKGFWASLFSPKPCSCSCSCGDNLVRNEEVKAENGNIDIKEIKVLGPGCAKCKSTYSIVEKVINENHLDVKLTKVEDITEIIGYNVMATPALVVDGVVKMTGRVPSEKEVRELLNHGRQ